MALVKAQMEMGNAKKESVNPFYKKMYADLNSVREVTIPTLNAHGISVLQPTTVIDGISYVETILLHESGEFISSLSPIITDKPNDAQRHGSGLSYARRYALQSICNVGAEDDDAEKAVTKKPENNTIKMPEKKQSTLSEKALVDAVNRISKGEVDLIDKVEKAFALTPDQLKRMEDAIPELQPIDNSKDLPF